MSSFVDQSRRVPTFDQLNVFLAVVEERGFSAAARRLNRQQSVISYTISALEQQLGGIALFDRTTRRATLTEAGQAVLIDARRIAQEVHGLRARVAGLHLGVEAELSIALDAMLSPSLLTEALRDFRIHFPKVSVRISVEVLGGVPTCVMEGASRIGISGPLFYATDGLEQALVGSTTLLPVAAPGHPLAGISGPIPTNEARKHVQVVLTDRSPLSKGQEFGVLAAETVRVSDLVAKHCLIMAGLGWGNLPEAMVADNLAAGRLRHVPLAEGRERPYPFYAIHRVDTPPGPAGRWFVERMSRGSA